MSPAGLRHLPALSCPLPALSQLLTCGGTVGLFRKVSSSAIRLTYSFLVNCLDCLMGCPCARGTRSASRSRKTCRMGRLLISGLAGHLLSCPGPSWCSEVSGTASCLLYTAAVCPQTSGWGGAHWNNLYLTRNLHSKPQTYSPLSNTQDQ